MPVKFGDWDLDPGSGDLQSFFSLDLNGTDDGSEQRFYCNSGMSSVEDYCRKYPSPYFNDQFLEPASCETESEFYMGPGISPPNPLPNDDIWKKFDILDPADNFDFDDELSDMFEDLTNVTWMSPMYAQSVTNDAREIRNHDCMWAGHCISEKHDRNSQKNKCVNLLPIKKSQKSEEVEVVAVTNSDGTVTADGNRICGRKSAVVAPTHARSILLPTRVVTAPATPVSAPKKSVSPKSNATIRLNRSKTLDSGGESPRPETPQSLSDNEDLNLDLPDMKTVEDFAVDTFGYNFVNDIVQNVGSEDSNTDESSDDFSMYLFDRIQQGDTSNSSGVANPSKGNNKVKRTVVKQEVPISRHYTTNSFFSDHCYHLNKNARMDNLGVQTPSDSEEEIDVETVYGDMKKPNSRSSSSGAVLPTNPSLSDRQQLQLTVASAISKKEVKKQSARTATVSRYNLDERTLKSKMIPCKRKINVKGEGRRTGGSKRSAQFEQFDEYGEYVNNKSVKRKKYQCQRHYKPAKSRKRPARANHRSVAGGSSDSEVDSIERRTIHNSMERQRRIDLRNSFEELRKLIPHTAGNEKAAKVVILSYGAEFCKSLTMEDSELTRKKAELRRQQEMLMARVSQLRRSLAAQR